MSTLVIKNLPDALHAQLKLQAQRNHRSVTEEVVSLIEAALAVPQAAPKLSPPLKLRRGFRPTIDDIEAAIADGQR